MLSNLIIKFLTLLQRFIVKIQEVFLKNSEIRLIAKEGKKIIRDDFLYSFSKNISEYALKHPEKIEILKNRMDPHSIELIDTILERVNYIYTHNIIERDKIISHKELEGYKDIINSIKLYEKRSKLPHFDMTVFYYKHGLIYLPHKIVDNLTDKDFIDGGGYIGDSALLFEEEYNPRKIYSFEPNLNSYEKLLKTIKLNHLKKVIPVNMGLGRQDSLLELRDLDSASFIAKEGTYEIQVTSIDSFTKKNSLSVGLIKLDIEGYGFDAIQGAEETIKKFRPVLLISIYHSGDEFFEIKSYIEQLNLNYNFIIRKLGAPRSFYDTNLIAWVNDM